MHRPPHDGGRCTPPVSSQLVASYLVQCALTAARNIGRLVISLKVPSICKLNRCMYRFKSTDGLHWNPWLVIDPGGDKAGSDGALVYRDADGSYLQYIKASTAAPPGGQYYIYIYIYIYLKKNPCVCVCVCACVCVSLSLRQPALPPLILLTGPIVTIAMSI